MNKILKNKLKVYLDDQNEVYFLYCWNGHGDPVFKKHDCGYIQDYSNSN